MLLVPSSRSLIRVQAAVRLMDMLLHHLGSRQGYTYKCPYLQSSVNLSLKEEGQGTLEKAYEAMSDYIEVYDYKPETFASIKYAFTSKYYKCLKKSSFFRGFRHQTLVKIGCNPTMITRFAT